MTPTKHLRRLLSLILLLLIGAGAAVSFSGCSSGKKGSKSASSGKYHKKGKEEKISVKKLTPAQKKLVAEAQDWLGTPYKYGGNTKKGVDCSGLVYHVYRNTFDISLPRNSAKQHDYCTKVKKSDLVAGDLVFFATNRGSRKVSHVGLYMGDNKMIHASTKRGVMVQDLSAEYYAKAYVGAGRVDSFAKLNKGVYKKTEESKSGKSKGRKDSRKEGSTAKQRPAKGVHTPPSVPAVREVPVRSLPGYPEDEPAVPATRELPVQPLPSTVTVSSTAPISSAPSTVSDADPEASEEISMPELFLSPEADDERAPESQVILASKGEKEDSDARVKTSAPAETPSSPSVEPAVKAARIQATPAPTTVSATASPDDLRAKVLSTLPDAK